MVIMENIEITRDILERLTEGHQLDDITLGICERYNLSWPEAEALVLRVKDENQDQVTLRQAPLLTAVALVTFLAGLALMAIGLYPILLVGITLLQRGDINTILNSSEIFFSVNAMVRTGLTPLTAILLGLALVLGSLLGMRDVWAALLPKLRIDRW
jgi:hypothetical protein